MSFQNIWLHNIEARTSLGPAEATALELAKRQGAKLTVFGTLEPASPSAFRTSIGDELVRIVNDDRTARQQKLVHELDARLGAQRVKSLLEPTAVP